MTLPTTTRGRYRTTYSTPPTIASTTIGTNWKTLIEQGMVVPIIGNTLIQENLADDGYPVMIQRWADSIGYPWPDQASLTLVSQYLLMKDNEANARVIYLAFLKREMFTRAVEEHKEHQAKVKAGTADPKDGISEIQLAKTSEKIKDPRYSLTDLAYDLGRLEVERTKDHPLRRLAGLPFPIYLTTSCHRFLEVALFQAGKRPVSEVYHWNPRVNFELNSIFSDEPTYKPDKERPLVYHLFGRDDLPESLVLSESDYLEVLINLSAEKGGTQVGNNTTAAGKPVVEGLPPVIKTMLTQPGSTPLLLGFDLGEWDFRILFRGLILANHQPHSGEGILIQLLRPGAKDEAKVKESLEKYMREASKLKIFWGTVTDCMKEIDKAWRV